MVPSLVKLPLARFLIVLVVPPTDFDLAVIGDLAAAALSIVVLVSSSSAFAVDQHGAGVGQRVAVEDAAS